MWPSYVACSASLFADLNSILGIGEGDKFFLSG